jgi:hypothetical protein
MALIRYPDDTGFRQDRYKYIPNEDFAGIEHFVMEVEGDGLTVQVHYHLDVRLPGEPTYAFDEEGNKTDDLEACPQSHWKIALHDDQPGNPSLPALLADVGQALTGFARAVAAQQQRERRVRPRDVGRATQYRSDPHTLARTSFAGEGLGPSAKHAKWLPSSR